MIFHVLSGMTVEPVAIVTTSVLFVATLIRSAFGFGEALVAVPLLALIVPVEVAAPVAALVSVTVAGIAIVQEWRMIHLGSARRLVALTFLAITFGVRLLTTVSAPVV